MSLFYVYTHTGAEANRLSLIPHPNGEVTLWEEEDHFHPSCHQGQRNTKVCERCQIPHHIKKASLFSLTASAAAAAVTSSSSLPLFSSLLPHPRASFVVWRIQKEEEEQEEKRDDIITGRAKGVGGGRRRARLSFFSSPFLPLVLNAVSSSSSHRAWWRKYYNNTLRMGTYEG